MKKLLPLFIIIITIMSCCEKNTDLELNVLDKLSAQESWKVESSLNYFKFNEEGEYVQASGRSISETEVCYTLIDISTVQNIEIVESNTEDDHYYTSFYFNNERLYRDVELSEGVFTDELIASDLDLYNLNSCI
jgi:hypothetical protein